MNSENIATLLTRLGCKRVKLDSKSSWVGSTCPLAPWFHTKGVDNTPSFGVSVHSDKKSRYNCYSCGRHGSLMNLIETIQNMSHRDMSVLGNWVLAHDTMSPAALKEKLKFVNVGFYSGEPSEVGGIKVSASVARRIVVPEPPPLPETDLDVFSPPDDEVMTYLTSPKRRLTEDTIKKWEIKWHPGRRRIAIPIRNVKGELVGISGRAMPTYRNGEWVTEIKPKFLHSSGFRRDFYLYGEKFCTQGVPGYKTEGFFDVMYLHQNGINAFAIMGSFLSKIQIEKCVQFFTRVVDIPDGDKAGKESVKRTESDYRGRIPYVAAKVPDGKDPDELSDEELQYIRSL